MKGMKRDLSAGYCGWRELKDSIQLNSCPERTEVAPQVVSLVMKNITENEDNLEYKR